jgi:hypothetical protein
MVSLFSLRRGPRMYLALCGHKTPAEGELVAFGDSLIMPMPRNLKKQYPLCPKCLSEKAIQCAWCNRAIFVGESVTLQSPSPGRSASSLATKSGGMYVGCLRHGCKQAIASVGVWTMNYQTGATYVGELETGRVAYERALAASRFAPTKPKR